MQSVTTIGFDIAKSVFQVHGIGGEGEVVIRRQLKRRHVLVFFQKVPPCLVGIEACASSHHWSRELQALGHTVRLMPPAYVKPYVKRHKNDATDAEAICKAGGPTADCTYYGVSFGELHQFQVSTGQRLPLLARRCKSTVVPITSGFGASRKWPWPCPWCQPTRLTQSGHSSPLPAYWFDAYNARRQPLRRIAKDIATSRR